MYEISPEIKRNRICAINSKVIICEGCQYKDKVLELLEKKNVNE